MGLLGTDSAKNSNHVLMETFFDNRNFKRHKESSHVTCYQACRSFEIFIICLAFLLTLKVNVTAITVKSTSRELDGESFSHCPGTFVKQFSVITFCRDLTLLTRRLYVKKITQTAVINIVFQRIFYIT